MIKDNMDKQLEWCHEAPLHTWTAYNGCCLGMTTLQVESGCYDWLVWMCHVMLCDP